VALSVAYGIMSLKCSKIAYPIVTCILQLSVSGLPWLFSLALNVLMVLLVINIIYKRYQNKAIRFRDTPEATGIDTGSRANITDKLLQQVARNDANMSLFCFRKSPSAIGLSNGTID
jgi:hypothetical protein